MTQQEKRLCGRALLPMILSRLALSEQGKVAKVVPMPKLGVPLDRLFDQFMEVCSPEKASFIRENFKTIIAKGRMISELEARECYDFYVKGNLESGKVNKPVGKVERTSKAK